MKRLVNVEINGNVFNLKTDAEQEYVDQLTDYVNSKIKEIEVRVPFKSIEKITMLSAFFIADEFFSYKKQQEKIQEDREERMKHLLEN